MTALTLNIHRLTVSLGAQVVLRDVSAQLPAGKLTVIIGPNGAGKSTLLRATAGLLTPSHGQVELGAFGNVQDLSPVRRGQHLAWVPEQSLVPFAFRVDDTVMLGRFPWHRGAPAAADHAAVKRALTALDIAHLAARRLTALSSGERQKVMLARGLAAETPVLLLDEPCANLDVGAALQLLNLLTQLAAGGKTIGVSMHDLALGYRVANHAICLATGSVVATGPRASVFTAQVLGPIFGVRSQISRTVDGDESLMFSLPGAKT